MYLLLVSASSATIPVQAAPMWSGAGQHIEAGVHLLKTRSKYIGLRHRGRLLGRCAFGCTCSWFLRVLPRFLCWQLPCGVEQASTLKLECISSKPGASTLASATGGGCWDAAHSDVLAPGFCEFCHDSCAGSSHVVWSRPAH